LRLRGVGISVVGVERIDDDILSISSPIHLLLVP